MTLRNVALVVASIGIAGMVTWRIVRRDGNDRNSLALGSPGDSGDRAQSRFVKAPHEHAVAAESMKYDRGIPEPRIWSAHEEPNVEGNPASAPKEVQAARPQQDAESTDERIRFLEQVLDKEARDPAWSNGARTALLTAFERPGFEHVDVYCKTTFCRIDLRLSQDAEVQASVRAIPMAAPWTGRGFTSLDMNEHRAVFYLARVGYDLPHETSAAPDNESRGQAASTSVN